MKPIRFLYWNTGEKDGTQEQVLTDLFMADGVPDVVLLGESVVDLSAAFLQQHGLAQMPYNLLPPKKGSKTIETQVQRVYFQPQRGIAVSHLTTDGDIDVPVKGVSPAYLTLSKRHKFVARAVLLRLEVDGEATLVACVHLASRIGGHHDEPSLLEVASRFKTYIAQAGGKSLSEFGERIAIVGDFNMNPFDLGMVQPTGFYALNNRDSVRHSRDFYHSPELMFYNPCWALLSDVDLNPPAARRLSGSHYYGGAPSKKLYWHLYDQVVFSQSLIDRFVPAGLRIASYALLEAEVTNPKTKRKTALYSDHLPLCFTLNLG